MWVWIQVHLLHRRRRYFCSSFLSHFASCSALNCFPNVDKPARQSLVKTAVAVVVVEAVLVTVVVVVVVVVAVAVVVVIVVVVVVVVWRWWSAERCGGRDVAGVHALLNRSSW
jgi:cobalamin synthase